MAIIGNDDMDMLICGNFLDYIEDEDKYIQINNMSMNETDNFHVERRLKVKVIT